MLNFLKQPKFPVALFIASSLAVFVFFIFLFLITKISPPLARGGKDVRGKYYLNENYSEGDLLITKVPRLKDMLAGPIISDLDPWMGSEEAPAIIVIFSDYQCGFCQKQEKILQEAIGRYEGKIRLIRKDYPESDENSISFLAAAAGRCAQEQKKFWEYHDLLYENNKNLSQLTFLKIADSLNLDRKDFIRCLDNDNIKQLIKDNIEEANALDITGVPFIYVNDREVMGQVDLEELERIIEVELDKK